MPEKRDEIMICLALSSVGERRATYFKENRCSFLISA